MHPVAVQRERSSFPHGIFSPANYDQPLRRNCMGPAFIPSQTPQFLHTLGFRPAKKPGQGIHNPPTANPAFVRRRYLCHSNESRQMSTYEPRQSVARPSPGRGHQPLSTMGQCIRRTRPALLPAQRLWISRLMPRIHHIFTIRLLTSYKAKKIGNEQRNPSRSTDSHATGNGILSDRGAFTGRRLLPSRNFLSGTSIL